MQKDKVLVIGGAGFIGSHLVDVLIEQGKEVLVIDNLSAGKKENLNPKAQFFQKDICDLEGLLPIFEEVEIVFHLAAIPRAPISIEDPSSTSRTNILGTVNVFQASRDKGVKRVVFASSSSVYGNQAELSLKEDMIPMPISPYGLQKLAGEQFAKMFGDLYGLSIICLRYFNVYGPRIDVNSDYSLVLGKFLKQKSQGKPLTICGTGEQTRGFCFVSDVVKANILASQSEKVSGFEVINIGSFKSHTVNFLADLIGGEKQYLPERKGDILHTQADIRKAKELLRWEPEVDFEKGVEITKKWFEEQI